MVAAAGNSFPENAPKPVHCPAAVEDVIAVGGFVAECGRADSTTKDDTDRTHPNGAYWAHKRDDTAYPPGTPDRVFCGQDGCDGNDCIENKYERPWEGNTNATDGKPDVLAPVHFPDTTSGGYPYLQVGSSFAAPVVTGALGMIFGELIEGYNGIPSAWDTRQSLISSSVKIDEGKLRKLNVQRTLNALAPSDQASYSY